MKAILVPRIRTPKYKPQKADNVPLPVYQVTKMKVVMTNQRPDMNVVNEITKNLADSPSAHARGNADLV